MSRLFGHSRQGFYKKNKTKKEKLLEQQQVVEQVLRERSQLPRLGTRKLKHQLSLQGLQIGRDRLFSLLRLQGLLLKPVRRYEKTTQSRHWMRKHPNLVKELEVVRADQVWVSDITYLRTDQGFVYLSLVTDRHSRRIMGYDVSQSLRAEGALRALQMALTQRHSTQEPLIHHSDRGLQYCCQEYQQLLKGHQISCSMTQDSDPYENALAERMNGILKQEFYLDRCFASPQQAGKAVAEAVYLYNTRRPHLSLKMQTPEQVYKSKTPCGAAATQGVQRKKD